MPETTALAVADDFRPDACILDLTMPGLDGVEVTEARWSQDPDGPSTTYADLYGNPCRRVTIPAGNSVVE